MDLHSPPDPSPTPADLLGQLRHLFADHGHHAYLGEAVNQTEHALQTAWAAEQAGAPPALIAAALLHDVGHLLLHEGPLGPTDTVDHRHEAAAASWLGAYFGPAVCEPVRLHVAAKRYLCAVEPAYHAALSPASQASLRVQGGPMTADERSAFADGPYGQAAVALRRWDDAAKVPGLATPPLEHFLPFVETALGAKPH